MYIDKTSQYVSKKALDEKKVILVPLNSVLITCTATIGKVAINKISLCTNQQINALICDKEKVNIEYLVYFLRTQKQNLENLTLNLGVKHINISMLTNFKFSLPSLAVQNIKAKEIKTLEDEKNILEQSIETLNEKKMNIVKKYL